MSAVTHEALDALDREFDVSSRMTGTPEPWPELQAFDSLDLPRFPVDALSPWMRDWAAEEAEATQTPVDLPACIALGCASLATARAYHVQVRPGWREPTNLWIVVALPPGERKSSVFGDATAPVYAYIRHQAESLGPSIAAAAFERATLEGQIKDAAAAAVKGKLIGGADARDHARLLRDQLAKLKEVRAPVLLTDDCTAEALAVLLSQQGERIGIFSAEGGPFDLMAGRYSDKSSNFEIYLKAHPGDPHTAHRISRDPVMLAHPLVTMALTVQPSVIASLAEKDGFRGRGLLARFLYSLPKTSLGKRSPSPSAVQPATATAYQTAIASMLVRCGEQRDLKMSPEADQLRHNFQRILEPRLGPDGGDLFPIGDWANKLVGAVCRIAGVLHVSDFSMSDVPAEIPFDTMIRAVSVGEYFLAHSVGAFDVMRTDPAQDLARRIWGWISRMERARFTEREALNSVRSDTESTAAALRVLVERGMVRPMPVVKRGMGRPPSTTYEVYPLLVASNNTEAERLDTEGRRGLDDDA